MRRSASIPILALSLGACAPNSLEPARALIVPMPGRIRSALASTDSALCQKLEARLTFGKSNDLGSPAIDKALLDPKMGQVCTWVLSKPVDLTRGTYDLIVRFNTKDAPGTCSGPIIVGAYVKRGITFPFPADFMGLTDADFYSRPGQEAMLKDSTVNFNIAMDGRDNLAKLADGADPCKASSIPQATLSANTLQLTETSTVILDLASSDADDAPHVVTLRIKHHNGPSLGTETIVWKSYTDERGGGLATHPMALERWSFRALPDADPKKGAGKWRIVFVPDEPFVFDLSASAADDDGQGNILSHTATITLHVNDKMEPATLLFGDTGPGTPEKTLRFQQQADTPTAYRFRFYDEDIGANYSMWTPSIASAPMGVVLSRDAGFWRLEWNPTLDQTLNAPAGGYPISIAFRDPGGTVVNTSSVAAQIFPRFNNPPVFMPPNVGDLDLPAPPYTEHRIPFEVIDPDMVDAAPTCMATIAGDAGTTCMNAFSSVRCEPRGNRSGTDWPFVVILTPGPSYASCGMMPGFLLSLVITDVPPADSVNGPQSAGTGSTPLSLRTASVVGAAIVSGGPGAVAGGTSPSPPLIHGTSKRAIIQMMDAGGNAVVTVVDLTRPSPSFLYAFPQAQFCSLDANRRPHENFASDEAHGRMLVISRGNAACADNGLNLVNMTQNPPTTVFHTSMEICGEPFNDREGNPGVDPTGNFWLPCQTAAPSLVRFKPDGTITSKPIPAYSGNDSTQNRRSAVVTDPAGKSWLVWPDSTGLLLVDLSTFDNAAPTTMHIAMDAAWATNTIDDAAADPWRPEYLVAYNRSGTTAELLRVRFQAAPALDAPLDLGNIGGNTSNGYSYMRLVFRNASPGTVDPGPDLVVAGGSSTDPVPHVDLDSWTVSAVRPVTDYYLGGGSAGIFGSPDKRFYVAPTSMNHETGARGIYLYRFDPAVARQFVTLPVPNGGADWAGRTDYSDIAKLMVISEADSGAVSVIYFIEAELGRDG